MAYATSFGQLDPVSGLPKKQAAAGGFTTGAYGAPSPIGMAPSTTPYFTSPLPGSTDTGGVGGVGGGTGGSSFNLQALLDSLLNPIKSDLAAQGQVDLASRNAAINRGLVQFGEVPNFADAEKALGLDLGSIVSPDTAQLASSNPYSAVKQIAQHHVDAVRQIKHALAARNALQSGELGYQLNKETQDYGQNQYTARQQLLDMLAGIQNGYLAGQRAAQATLANSGNTALQQLLGLFPNGLPTGDNNGGGGSAPPPPNSGYTAPPPTGGALGGGAPQQQPVVGSYIGLPTANAAAGQRGRLERANFGQL